MNLIFYCQLFILLTFVMNALGDGNNIITINNIFCSSNKTVLTNFTCTLKAKSRSKTLVNANAELIQTVSDLWGTLRIYKKNSMHYLPFVVNSTDNLCDYFTGKTKKFYTKFALQWFLGYCNIKRSCPQKPASIRCKDMDFTLTGIPVFVPLGEFRTVIQMHDGKLSKPFVTIITHSTIGSKIFTPQYLFEK